MKFSTLIMNILLSGSSATEAYLATIAQSEATPMGARMRPQPRGDAWRPMLV